MRTTSAIRKQTARVSIFLSALFISVSALAQQKPQTTPAAEAAKPVRQIIVSIPDRKLALLEDGEIVKVYSVAVGKATTPSPSGAFRIVNRVTNPTYYHEGKIVPAGPGNPVGTRWMGLSEGGYGIHGTNAPTSIGKAASHGCIRMARRDLEELFEMVEIGDAVEIRAERDDQTARLFGDGGDVLVATNSAPRTAAE